MKLITQDSAAIRKVKSIAMMQQYKLPGDPSKDKYFCGISGGVDSTALGIILCVLFPAAEIEFVFTDTGEETPGTLESIQRFEEFTGKRVTRLAQEDGLFGLVELFGGYLPSSTNRFCTRLLKTEQFENYLEEVYERCGDNSMAYSFVGLRFDEPGRSGLDSSMPWLRTVFPLRELGLVREDVFRILSETVSIPSFYSFRTRSSCIACWGFRTSEIIGSLYHHPKEFERAQAIERLTPEDQERYALLEDDFSGSFVIYPVPSDLLFFQYGQREANERRIGKSKGKKVVDLFGETVRIYVGVEFLQDFNMDVFFPKAGGNEFTTGVWWNNLVGWSTTRGGISRKLNSQFTYRLDTAEVFGITQDDLREEYKTAVYLVEFPAGLIDIDPPTASDKKPDGRIVDAGGNSILVHGKPVYIRNKKLSKSDRAALRKQGIHSVNDYALYDEFGNEIDAVLTDDGLFCDPVPLEHIRFEKHSDELQKLGSPNGNVLLGGTVCYREKKGKVLRVGSFTWKRGEPIAQVRQITSLVKATMMIEYFRQVEKAFLPFKDGDCWKAEEYRSAVLKLSNINFSYGEIVGMESYIPDEKRPEQLSESEIPCFACSK